MKNILVVEDSESTRSMMRTIIEDLGEEYQVFEAGTGFEALKILPTEGFSLIITDINMPDINGIELINFVKTTPQYKDIPMIIVSTERSEEDKKRGLALGAEAYITKPFRPEDFQEKIRLVLSS
ncbi:MAG: response regulator [Nitrospirota bacterium]|nr:response regulator [Nitrospirota bacterium]GMT47251.1 MAG: response regulator [bacterium]